MWEEEGRSGGGPLPEAHSHLPWCSPKRKAAPWAQGLPSTSARKPWAPAPSSFRAWVPLNEMVATMFQEARGSSATLHRTNALEVAQPPVLGSG